MQRHPLISAHELAGLFQQGPGVRPLVLDVRWKLGADDGYDSYLQGHIPGAVYVDLEHDLAGVPGPTGGRHPMPRIDDFEMDMAECGVDNDRPVVIYDDANSVPAARAWWMLRHFGKVDVQVLDGGLKAWKEARLPMESGIRLVDEGDFSVRRSGLTFLTADTAALYANEGMLVDGRSPHRFTGEIEPVDPVAGHIPGSVNLPFYELLDSDTGKLLPQAELRRLFGQVGATDETPVASTCGSGVVACFMALAHAAAGLEGQVPVYIGSWSDWISDPNRPVETGPSSRQRDQQM